MSYQHRFVDGSFANLPMGKVVCVGRNYAEHAKELNNPVPTEPLLFIKPATAVVDMAEPLVIPTGRGAVHYETEIAILIGEALTGAVSDTEAEAAIAGVGLALDLTLRELQDELKAKAHPWERAKAFDGACPLSSFVPRQQAGDLAAVPLQLKVNGELRQDGSSADMLTPIVSLLRHISPVFSLLPGDVIITGTPKGVGQLKSGDELEASIPGLLVQVTRVV